MKPTSAIYDHRNKAGNVGDVWKHAVLASLASRVPATESFLYVESHCGAPLHELKRPGEWERGIESVLARGPATSHPYLSAARKHVARLQYPAGWWFFSNQVAQRVPRISLQLHDASEAVALRYAPLPGGLRSGNGAVTFTHGDGYTALDRLQQADLVFLDPPFHPVAKADWQSLAQACMTLRRRSISFLAWYPFYWPSRPQALVDTTGETAWEVAWAPCGSKPSQNLKGCGVLISEPLVRLIESARSETGRYRYSAGWKDCGTHDHCPLTWRSK